MLANWVIDSLVRWQGVDTEQRGSCGPAFGVELATSSPKGLCVMSVLRQKMAA